ncbi:MAG: BREX system P-loop protein BrxC [Firmicutes bacterium]|nr:BREX system P-loop protein BrxC [Bacillota bacterium]
MRVGDLLVRDPFRPLESVVKITDHDPSKVWSEMNEYVPTETLKRYFREIADTLVETRRGTTERACVWVSGFFGSGKSHFVKVLGYLLESRDLEDQDGHRHPSTEFLCRKLGLESFLPLLRRELCTKVIYINLLDHDPQSPQRPTFSRLIYRKLLEQAGLSTEFWVAAWEKELQRLGKWEEFRSWVQQTYGRTWEEERRLHAEVVLRRALPALLSNRYRTENEAVQAIQDSKRVGGDVSPSEVVAELRREAEGLDPQKGRLVLLLDEAGLYIGESIERLTDLNALAEQVVQQGGGKILLIATAQEALTDLVPRLTRDRHILEWLRDRFRLRLGLEPTEVQAVVAARLLAKKTEGVVQLEGLYRANQGALLSTLNLDGTLTERNFVEQYPCPPYAVRLMQDIMGAMRGSVEEARRLSGSERSMLKLVHAILTGEAGLVRGADQPVGWLISLDLFYDALAPDLSAVRSEQVRVIRDLERLGEVDALPVARITKVLFLLQQVREHYPCTPDTLAAALVDKVDADISRLAEAVREGLRRLQEEGWVVEEEGKFRLLTPVEHELEHHVQKNYPTLSEMRNKAAELVREMLRDFRYLHGQIRRRLPVAISVDGEGLTQEGDLAVELFTPLAEKTEEDILALSIAEQEKLFWKAAERPELRAALERTLAVEHALEQWRTRHLTPTQEEHRNRLEREVETARQIRLPQLLQQAFLRGKLFLAGRELSPSENDMASVLHTYLATLTGELFTEFLDDRPERDEDCGSILGWQVGAALPPVYGRLGLVTPANQLNQDARLLSVLKAELTRRQQRGLPAGGGDLVSHFEKKPYGWDPRVVRMLAAGLFKAGLVRVRYQNRELTDPADPQAQTIFTSVREFQRAVFALLPPVDWRRASELCSSIFGVPGGDTFERAAAAVQEQARDWAQEAGQLVTRCQDNGLPACFVAACQQAAQTLGELVRCADPNNRLRRFLELANTFGQTIPLIRRLKEFAFDRYRQARNFVQVAADWGSTLSGEAARRWQELREGLQAGDLLERWDPIRQDYAFLLGRYRESYGNAHRAFQEAVHKALDQIRRHGAFRRAPEAAEEALAPLESLRCETDSAPEEETFRCSGCQRSFAALSLAAAEASRRLVENVLDDLVPRPAGENVEPFVLRRTISQETDLDALSEELRRYWRRAGCPVEVEVKARTGGEERC